MNKLRIASWLAFSLCCLAMVADCARVTVSEYVAAPGTAEALRRAVKIWPYRADQYRYLAVLEPESGDAWFGESIARNSRDARSWERMGLQAEAEGRFDDAERNLIEATRLDRTYEPRWTLCNYYFRRGDNVKFWQWAREAAALGPDDLTPLFDLCWRVRGDAEAVVTEIVPPDCVSRRRFFSYLQAAGATLQAGLVAPRVVGCADDESRRLVAQFTNTLLFSGKPAEALQLWNGLTAGRHLPFQQLDSLRGPVLSNGDFDELPSNMGFDWHVDPARGLSVLPVPGSKGLRLQFDGWEPDAFAVLYQPVPLRADTPYRLSFEVETRLPAVPEGFRWRLADIRSGAAVTPDGSDFAGAPGKRTWDFRSSKVPVQALALVYERPGGSTRFQGSIDLRRVELAEVSVP